LFKAPALFTSCFGAKTLIIGSGHAAIRTSIGHPRWKLAYPIDGICRLIMPTRPMLRMERDEYLAQYEAMLDDVGFDAIAGSFHELSDAAGGRHLILLCFEDLSKAGLWCHRRMFADWWQRSTGEEVRELAPKADAQPALF
jgi:hypothetical protein